MSKSVEVYLMHILDEISYLKSLDYPDSGTELKEDPTLSRAVVRSLEVIGEAASKIDTEYKNSHSEIPWRKIVGLRNRLIHDYMGINYNIVLDVLKNEIQTLGQYIESLLK